MYKLDFRCVTVEDEVTALTACGAGGPSHRFIETQKANDLSACVSSAKDDCLQRANECSSASTVVNLQQATDVDCCVVAVLCSEQQIHLDIHK